MTIIYLASGNHHKITEMSSMLDGSGFILKSMTEEFSEVTWEENADTFRGNATIKARALRQRCQSPVLADDSGLVVPSLGGQPGVFSARFAGENAKDHENNEKLLLELENNEQRDAYFICQLCFIDGNGHELFFEGKLNGEIGLHLSGKGGFGYDPLFYLPDGRSLAELTPDQKNQISHRAVAMKKLKDFLSK